VLIANLEQGKPITATLDLPNAGTLLSATPEEPDARPASASLRIPARSVVAIMEQ